MRTGERRAVHVRAFGLAGFLEDESGSRPGDSHAVAEMLYNQRRNIDGRNDNAAQTKIKARVARAARLVKLKRQDVRAFPQQSRAGVRRVILKLIRATHRSRGERVKSHDAGRHVHPEKFHPVQVGDASVVPQDAEGEVGDRGQIRDLEMMPVVGRPDRLAIGVVDSDDRGGRVIGAELRRTRWPCAVVKIRRAPVRSLVDSGIEIVPDRSRRNQ